MALATVSDVNTAFPGQIKTFTKGNLTGHASGNLFSTWNLSGNPAAGGVPTATTPAIPTAATTGAIPFTNPTSGNTYLARLIYSNSSTPQWFIYDRLWHVSTTTTTGAATFTTPPAINRAPTTGEGVEIFVEVYVATTGGPTTSITASYTNQAGTTGRTATAIAQLSASPIGLLIPMTLTAGDTGVQNVASATLAGTALTAGTWGITLARRVAEMPFYYGRVTEEKDWMDLALPTVPDNACLGIMGMMQATSSGEFSGELNLIQG